MKGMKKNIKNFSLNSLFIACFSMMLFTSCSDSSDDSTDTETEEVDETGESPLEGIGEVEVAATGFISTEGPAWHEASESIFFTDIPGNTIYSLDVNTFEVSTLRSPSDTSNGLAIDAEGYLLAAEHGTRTITRMDLTTNEVNPYIETVNYEGEDKMFNSPNDLVIHSNGNIYFTDPSFGLGNNESDLGFNGFYVRKTDGTVELLKTFEYDTEESPNGVILSPDEETLYLAVSHSESGPILAYDVDEDGNLSNEREFAAGQNLDGMAIDEEGNLYVAALEGIDVWSKDGDYWGSIVLPDNTRTTNVAFGTTEMNTLYITNRSSNIYAVELDVVGHK